MKKKCELCEHEFSELDLFHYEQEKNGVLVEVKVCENCLFDLVGNEFCDSDFL